MSKSTKSQWSSIQYRALPSPLTSIDNEAKTVEAVFATETPVLEFDFERREMIPTVLLMSGCQLPKSRQLVMLDNHSRFGPTGDNIKGSGRDVRVENRQLIGTLHLSSLAAKEWTLISEGHMSAVSIGRTDNKSVYVAKGDQVKLDGVVFTGPMKVVTSWTPREISLTPIGADINATMRELNGRVSEQSGEPDPASHDQRSAQTEVFQMNAVLKALLVARGLAKDATDEQAISFLVDRGMPADIASDGVGEWVANNLDRLPDDAARSAASNVNGASSPVAANGGNEQLSLNLDAVVARALTRHEQERRARRALVADHLRARNESLRFDQATIDRIAADSESVADADNAIFAELARRQTAPPNQSFGPVITAGREQAEKLEAVMRTAIAMRTLQPTCKSPETLDAVFPKTAREPGWEQFRHASLLDFARLAVRQLGMNPDYMTHEDIAKAALFGNDVAFGVRAHSAYHTPSAFPNILLDAINKNMQAAYSEYPSTCEFWARQAPSVNDFKDIHVIKLGAIPNLQDWDAYSPLPEVSRADAKETYAVEAKAGRFSISWKTIVNDDQNMLSMVPAAFGAAARRTRNQMVYAQIARGTNGNGRVMSDGQQLFSTATGNRLRANLLTGAGAPAVATVQALSNLMMQQVGLNTPENAAGPDILGTQPAYIIGPSALRTTILQLVRSTADPTAGGNAGVFNPWQGLTPIIEPYLDSQEFGTTAWYLASRWQDCPHVEYTHLVGQETPKIESWVDPSTKCIVWDAIQTMAACAVDHRGICKHRGQ